MSGLGNTGCLSFGGRFVYRLGLTLASAILLGLPGFGYEFVPHGVVSRWMFRPEFIFPVFVGLVPWVVLYTDERNPRVSVGYYLFGAWAYWWMSYPAGAKYAWYVPGLGAIINLIPFLWAFAPALKRIHRVFGLPRALTVPIIWVATEWLRATLSLAHFEYVPIGYTMAHFRPFIQIADITGVYGVSFLIAAFNGLLADLYFELRDAGWSVRRALGSRRWRRGAVAVGVAWLVAGLYGAVRISTIGHEEGPRVAIVQPSVAHTIKNSVGVHIVQLRMTERNVEAGAVDLIVWPENAIADDILRPDAYLDDLRWLVQRKQAWLLLGAAGAAEEPGKTTNGAFLLDDSGEIVGRYDKQVLFPWTEYAPLENEIRKLSPSFWRGYRNLIRKVWGFLPIGTAGDRMVLLEFPWEGELLPFGAVTCSENYYPPIPRQAARLGARFLAHLTSEGEAGGAVHKQMLRACIFRAVENRLPYVRAGNTGISCMIDSTGRLQSVLRGTGGRAVEGIGILHDRIPLPTGGKSLYVLIGDLFAIACVAITAFAVVLSFFPGVRTQRARTDPSERFPG